MQREALAERYRQQAREESNRNETKGKDTNMKLDELYPSRWLKASDLQGRQVVCTIQRVVVEDLGDGSKPVVYFTGKEKGRVLNRTNADTSAAALGDDTDKWPGGKVTLFSARVSFKGTMTDAIRLTAEPRPAAVTRQPGEDLDADLRF
jgi:hypothetical protein